MQTAKTVKVPAPAYEVLAAHAKKTGRRIGYLLERAIMRCYGEGAKS